jgi:hypothetical protein
MKKHSVKRGLYRRDTVTPETDEELLEVFRGLRQGSYLDWVEQAARQIVAAEGIDPDTLFDRIVEKRGDAISNTSVYDSLDRDTLSPEADLAVEILFNVRNVRPLMDDPKARSAFKRGISISSAVERLKVNRLEKPVRAGIGTSTGGKKGAQITHGPKGTKAAKYLEAFLKRRKLNPEETRKEAREHVARQFNLKAKNSYKTIERHTKGL